ncbi:MAG: Hsp70 family protein [Rubrobacteraceae bacterium]
MDERAPAIGIDFGTANSSMSWYDPRTGSSEVILNAEGQVKTHSVVHFGEDEILVGEPVEGLLRDVSTDRARRDEAFRRTIVSIKRNLLSPPRIALPGGRYIRPVDVVAEIIKKLKRDAEDGLFHEEVGRAVITCPAEFNVLQRQKIEDAGHLAGFDEVVLLEEPVAGAVAYAQEGLDVGKHVLVYDLGGGTFDLAVLDNEDESFHVAMEPKGMERCGGDDFDLALYHYCDEIARENLERPISLTGTVDLTFLRVCRRGKESLTFQKKGRVSDYLVSENGPVRFEHEVDRPTFEELIGEYVETTTRLTKEILSQASDRGHEVDTVVLVGGSTRVPLVTRTLQETLPVPPLGFDRKDVAVALGAAHYTNIRWAPAKKNGKPKPVAPETEDRVALDQYRAAVEETASDRKLNKVEIDRLNAFSKQLELRPEQVLEVERQVLGSSKEEALARQYQAAVEAFWNGEKLHELEAERLVALAEELGLDEDQISDIDCRVMGATKESILERRTPRPELSEPENLFLAHILIGHSDKVNSVAFSPDGQFLASGASDHAVRGWNARTGQSTGTLVGNLDRVSSVAFDPNGELLASGGFDNTIRVWKLPNGEPFHILNHADWVFSIAFSPDSKVLASGGADKEIKLWNLDTGELIRSLHGDSHWILSVAFSPDGETLVGGSADERARVWDLKTGETLYSFEHPDWVRSVAVDPDGKFLATGSEDGTLTIWDLETGKLAHSLAGHSGPVLSVAVSPDGQLLFSGGHDGKVKVWALQTGEPLNVLLGHPGGVGSIVPGSDGQLLASGGYDGKVKVWRMVSDLVEAQPADPPDSPADPQDSPGPRLDRPPDLPD